MRMLIRNMLVTVLRILRAANVLHLHTWYMVQIHSYA